MGIGFFFGHIPEDKYHEKSKPELGEELREITARFLNQKLGEFPTSLQAKLWDNMCIIRAVNALAPAEAKLIENNSADSQPFQNFIIRQFEEVKHILKIKLENAAGSDVLGMDFLIGKNNTQLLIVTFSARLQNKRGQQT